MTEPSATSAASASSIATSPAPATDTTQNGTGSSAPPVTAHTVDEPESSPSVLQQPRQLSSPAPPPAAPTADRTVGPQQGPSAGLPTVVPTRSVPTTTASLRQTTAPQRGLSVAVSRVQWVKGVARGPGEVAGPAVRVSLTLVNESRKSIPMDLALVNLYYGKDRTPASPLSGPGVAPLRGRVGAGSSATGRYVFGLPVSQRGRLAVEFSYSTQAPTVLFTSTP